MKPSATASVPQRARRSAVEWTPPKLVASATSSRSARKRCARSAPSSVKPTSGPKDCIWRAAIAWCGWSARPGWRTSSTSGRSRSQSARASAFALWRSSRRASVASERCSSQASNGPGDRRRPASGAARSARGPLGVADGDRAEDEVGVAGQRLGGAEHRGVGAEVERALAERRRERVVDGEPAALRVDRVGDGRDVGDVERRVRGRLDPRERRARARGHDRVGVGGDEPHLDPARRQPVAGDAAHPRVAVLHDDEDVAAAQRRLEHRADRRHPGGEQHRLPAVELADRLLDAGPGRVAVAPVAVRRGVLGALQVERRGEHRARRERRALVRRAGGRHGRRGWRGLAAGRSRPAKASLRPTCAASSSPCCCWGSWPRPPPRRRPRTGGPGSPPRAPTPRTAAAR